MIRILILIAVVLVVAVGALLTYAATKPGNFDVVRRTTIKAPPDKIFGFINDFHRWGAWSPYETIDPAMERGFSGAERGVGAVYTWSGNMKVGQGRMEMIESAPPSKIVLKLDFSKPIEGHNTAEFTLDPKDDATEVAWAMRGPTAFIAKVMSVFFDMDKMIGNDFEKGLANLKALAEG